MANRFLSVFCLPLLLIQTNTAAAAALPQAAPASSAELVVSSSLTGAEIELDGAFVGSTPSTIGVSAGDHTIDVAKSGYKTWERKIKVTSGKVEISAELEAVPPSATPATLPQP